MTLGERLYELRKAKGLSQESAADILGVTRQTVSKWETDQTTPDFDKIVPICSLYEITTNELLTGEKDSRYGCDNEAPYCTVDEQGKNDNRYSQSERYSYCNNESFAHEYTQSTSAADDMPIELVIKRKRTFALLLSAAIFLYILSPVPFFFSGRISTEIVMTIFFIIIAVATMLIVFASVSKIRTRSKSLKNATTKEQKLYKQIADVLSLVTLAVYLTVSFLTKAWGITWILWIVYALLCQIIKLIFSLKGTEINE